MSSRMFSELTFTCGGRNYKKYEEVRVPAVKTGGLTADEHLVKVSEMEEWAQLAFEGYKCAALLLDSLSAQSQNRFTALHVSDQ